MRNWLFKPFLFYPLLLIGAVLLVAVSLSPLSWPKPQAAVAGRVHDGALVLDGEALGAPAASDNQVLKVVRDFFGKAHSLRIAVKPHQTAPTSQETGIRILLDQNAAQFLNDKPLTIRIDYRPIPLTTASALAVNVEGARLSDWTSQPIAPETGSVSFRVPAQSGVSAIGLRAVEEGQRRNFGLEIVRIRVTPSQS